VTGATADVVIAELNHPVRLKPDTTDIPVPPKPRSSEGGSRTVGLVYADPARLLRRVVVANPESLDDYRAHGGYDALVRAFALGPAGIVREVSDSRLVGRGGALFPTGRKWDAVARAAARPHYMVCNADESEPGTFKDRLLMEEDPFAVIEAMTIAALATGCERGYIYIRGEYPLATKRLLGALAQARVAGLLGERVRGEPFRFDIELRRGAGAYICGEETALFNSIEGFRGEPRNKPPFPVASGLFGKPTVVNNVETLVNVLDVVRDGGAAFAATGTEQSTGTKLFCVSGCAVRPGVYEVPFGMTLKALIERAGGVHDGRSLQAVLLGGAAGIFVTPDEIDFPLTLEGARAANATLGSGVVMLFDDRVDMRDITLRIAEFFRHESCGQCVPCRVGTVRQEEVLHRLAARASRVSIEAEHALIDDLAQAMKDASICGLGQTASAVVQSAIRKLRVFG
jgi:NADH-quinone oxidoreductase subunit F